jgi:hypothetical protein
MTSTPANSARKGLRGYLPPLVQWLLPAIATLIGWHTFSKRFGYPVHTDAELTYLPAARAFLEQGWAYLLNPESYRVVPLAYLWPALWDADPSSIRIANASLWLACVFFIWNTSLILGGLRAAVLALALWTFHPEIPLYFSTELTEPIFLAGLFGWIFALAKITMDQKARFSTALLAGLGLCITLLSRPVLQLIAPLGLVVLLGYFIHQKITEASPTLPRQAIYRKLSFLAWSLALGLLVPGLLILKNGLLFGLWGLGTGSGAGLYLGTHPLFQGAEPAFLGFDYDINILAVLKSNEGDHLSLIADRASRSAAIWQIQSMSASESFFYCARKISWWLFHHPLTLETFGSGLRKLRIFELLTVVVACGLMTKEWCQYKRTTSVRMASPCPDTPQRVFFTGLLLTFGMLLVQLTPILYNSRYSSALLSPWLILLTAIGFSYITRAVQVNGKIRKNQLILSLAARREPALLPSLLWIILIAAATPVIYNITKKFNTSNIDPNMMGKTIAHIDISSDASTQTYGMKFLREKNWEITQSPAALQIKVNALDISKVSGLSMFNALWKTDLAIKTDTERSCKKAEISYQTEAGAILQPASKNGLIIPIFGDDGVQHFITHANREMRPQTPGSLRIVLNCPVGTLVNWQGTQLLESRHPWDAAEHTP